MATESEEEPKIDQFFVDLVSGYIRQIEHRHKLFIPPEIYKLCLIYYWLTDKFGIAHQSFKISSNGSKITKSSWDYKSALGTNKIDSSNRIQSMHYQWIVRINKLHRSAMIGITACSDVDILNQSFHGNQDKCSYAYDSFGMFIFHTANISKYPHIPSINSYSEYIETWNMSKLEQI